MANDSGKLRPGKRRACNLGRRLNQTNGPAYVSKLHASLRSGSSMTNEKCQMTYGKWFLALRGVVAFPRPNLRFVGQALNLYSYSSKLTVARLIGRIVAQTVLGADFGGHQRKRCASVLQARRQKILS